MFNGLLGTVRLSIPPVQNILGNRIAVQVCLQIDEVSGQEERRCGDGGKPCIGDGQLGAEGLFLCALESVDVLGHAWNFGPPAEHQSLEAEDVGGLKFADAVHEVLKHMAERHLVIIGGSALQQEKPCLLHNDLEEEAVLFLDGVYDALEVDLGGPFAIGFDAGGRLGVSLDCQFVGGEREFDVA